MRMGGRVVLAAALAAATARAEDLDTLVKRLGAGGFAERQAAAEAIEALGDRALPALREARESPDPEIQARASALIDRIEAAGVGRPTRVSLDFDDRPLSEVAAELGDRSGIPVFLATEPDAGLALRPITLREPEPVPFWAAVERLGDLASLRSELRPVPVAGDVAFGVALEGPVARRAPTSTHGPYRVKLLGLSLHHDLELDTPEEGAPDAGGPTLSGRLQVSAEPRLILGTAGPVRLLEAVDDGGRSLLPPAPPDEAGIEEPPEGAEYTGGPELVLPFPLRHPGGGPGGAIRRLRGTVRVAVAARKPGPVTVSLDGATGRTFAGDELTLTVRRLEPTEDGMATALELGLRPHPGSSRRPEDLAASPASALLEQQVEIVDRNGQDVFAMLTRSEVADGELRLGLTLLPGEGVGLPHRLTFHSLARTTAEVPFAFEDVPLP